MSFLERKHSLYLPDLIDRNKVVLRDTNCAAVCRDHPVSQGIDQSGALACTTEAR